MLRIQIDPFDLEEIKERFKKRTIITEITLRSRFDMIEDYLQFYTIRQLDVIFSKYIIDDAEIQSFLVLNIHDTRENYIVNGTRNIFNGYLTIKGLGIKEERLLKFTLDEFDYHIFIFKNFVKGFVGAAI